MTFKKDLLHDSYFTEEDKKAIENWSDEDVIIVYSKIIKELLIWESDEGNDVFSYAYCPFCRYIDIKDSDCYGCSYGKNHGICDDDKSDWQLFIKPLKIDYYRNYIKEWLINNFND